MLIEIYGFQGYNPSEFKWVLMGQTVLRVILNNTILRVIADNTIL